LPTHPPTCKGEVEDAAAHGADAHGAAHAAPAAAQGEQVWPVMQGAAAYDRCIQPPQPSPPRGQQLLLELRQQQEGISRAGRQSVGIRCSMLALP
jgi:hypothetical protein